MSRHTHTYTHTHGQDFLEVAFGRGFVVDAICGFWAKCRRRLIVCVLRPKIDTRLLEFSFRLGFGHGIWRSYLLAVVACCGGRSVANITIFFEGRVRVNTSEEHTSSVLAVSS